MHYSLAFFALTLMVEANPVAFPQAVTQKIAPSEPAPAGCTPAYVGNFAIVAQNISSTAGVAKRAADSACGQTATKVLAPVRQYIDGQIQGAMHTETITYQVPCPTLITQIGDGQIENPVAPPITQVGDGQIQNPVAPPVTQVGDGQIQNPVAPTITQIGDGQIQNQATPTSTAPAVTQNSEVVSQPTSVPLVTEASDAQPVVPLTSSSVTPAPASKSPPVVTEAEDAQPVVPSISSSAISAPVSSSVPVSSPVRPPAPPSRVVSSTSSTTGDASASRPTQGSDGLESCAESGALSITLEDGVLKDQQGRTGYIAANYQFQFDGPPQAGAIITAGFSVCANGSLALGGSSVFYQCLSGSFYNLYDRYWAAQCSPVTIDTIKLKEC